MGRDENETSLCRTPGNGGGEKENCSKTERARRKPCQEQTPLKLKRVEVWPETDVHKIKWKQTRHLRTFENGKAAKRMPTLGAR